MTEKLPWNRQDIFFDEVAEYPLYDHFPLLITTDPEQEIETSNDTQDTGVLLLTPVFYLTFK